METEKIPIDPLNPESGFIERQSISVTFELPSIVETPSDPTFFDTISHNAPLLILCTGMLIWRSARWPTLPAWLKYLAYGLSFLGLFGLMADLIHFQSRSEWGSVHVPMDVMTWELACLSIFSPFLLVMQKRVLLKKVLGLCLIALGVTIEFAMTFIAFEYLWEFPMCNWIS
ncbi:MAG: hypothetical protein IV090_08610 [Candidatus Sericytochromatia bacterium]|nr:hypothetical protein [Candidatus Sericytochromatia bacterium]